METRLNQILQEIALNGHLNQAAVEQAKARQNIGKAYRRVGHFGRYFNTNGRDHR